MIATGLPSCRTAPAELLKSCMMAVLCAAVSVASSPAQADTAPGHDPAPQTQSYEPDNVRRALADRGPETGYEMPRHVSLGADAVNLRRGPGLDYPIEWRYVRNGYPVQILDEYEAWRRIIDPEGDYGWVHKSLLSGRRTGIVTRPYVFVHEDRSSVSMQGGPDRTSCADLNKTADLPETLVACMEEDVIFRVLSCTDTACHIRSGDIEGHIPVKSFWGFQKPSP